MKVDDRVKVVISPNPSRPPTGLVSELGRIIHSYPPIPGSGAPGLYEVQLDELDDEDTVLLYEDELEIVSAEQLAEEDI